ncbi:hypothetical protein GS511_13065 [Leptospira borgpetersenii]|nr:hypothetical protein GS524_13055 [Leptospira borgpetersenii]QHE31099.1 hypothetical protein GS523_13060 [Leptospira borgpetersenii]QHE34401.1 hypothetical protein GS517_13055 [Leptospira borgpetersenii]QHE37630.1 hypothetical protein GS510_12695 [Leptospira borgpetersenii]QHE40996.1 hypothetical protein GS527_13350 [Leptospira borgpetersenii]
MKLIFLRIWRGRSNKQNNNSIVSFQFQRKAKNFCKIYLTRQMRFILWSLPLF